MKLLAYIVYPKYLQIYFLILFKLIYCLLKLFFLFRYYEYLGCTEVDTVIQKRLKAGETITLPNGKLLERLLFLKLHRYKKEFDEWGFEKFGETEKDRVLDETKAPFFKDLLPLAQEKMRDIRYNIVQNVTITTRQYRDLLDSIIVPIFEHCTGDIEMSSLPA
jgi:hypothetical protein